MFGFRTHYILGYTLHRNTIWTLPFGGPKKGVLINSTTITRVLSAQGSVSIAGRASLLMKDINFQPTIIFYSHQRSIVCSPSIFYQGNCRSHPLKGGVYWQDNMMMLWKLRKKSLSRVISPRVWHQVSPESAILLPEASPLTESSSFLRRSIIQIYNA